MALVIQSLMHLLAELLVIQIWGQGYITYLMLYQNQNPLLDTEYRCFYVHNAMHATLTMQNSVIWIQSNTTSADTSIEIALGSSAVNGTEQTIANENTAPTGVTFSAPSSF